MDSDSADKWIVCRVCLKPSEKSLHNIFDNEEMSDLSKMIYECAGVTVQQFDPFPDKICVYCLQCLRVAHKFRITCQRSHKHLVELFNSLETTEENEPAAHISDNTKEDMLEEIVYDDASNAQEENMDQNLEEEKPEIYDEYIIEEPQEISVATNNDDDINFIQLQNSVVELLGNDDSETNTFDTADEISTVALSDEATTSTQLIYNENDSNEKDLHRISNNDVEPGVSIIATQRKGKLSNTYSVITEDVGDVKPTTSTTDGRHSSTEEEENTSFICCHCGNMYFTKAKLAVHMRTHKEKPHQCEICMKRFAQTPQLARHMNSHTGNRPYKCKYCESRFADPSTCIKHERIHTNERPYVCEICGKAFSYTNVLKVHMMMHTGDKPFACEYCGKKFTQLHHKKTHERVHTMDEDTSERLLHLLDP